MTRRHGKRRARCPYCGRYTGNSHEEPGQAPRTCKRHSDLPELDATFSRKPERMGA